MAEMNGKYVNEQTHQKGKKFYKTAALITGIIAIIFVIIGIILLIVAANKKVPDMTQDGMGWFKANSGKNDLIFGGASLIMIAIFLGATAISLLVRAHQREILAYQASTIAPVAGETVNYMADETAPAIEKVSDAIGSGIAKSFARAKANSEGTKSDVKYCQECGAKNLKSAKFCSSCGKRFE